MKTNLPETIIMLAAMACLGADQPGRKPVRAILVSPKGEQLSGQNRVGNVEITFNDGRSEVVTTDGQSMSPQVSGKADIGWIETNHDTLIIRRPDGKTKEFKSPEQGFSFLLSWSFADNDTGVVILWGATHDMLMFLKYDIASGKVTGRVDHPDDYFKLPKWAQPAGRGHPYGSLQNVPAN